MADKSVIAENEFTRVTGRRTGQGVEISVNAKHGGHGVKDTEITGMVTEDDLRRAVREAVPEDLLRQVLNWIDGPPSG